MTEKALISDRYKAMNKRLHADHSDYGIVGGSKATAIVKMARERGFKTILDYGCGKGTFKAAVKKIAPDLTVLEFDPAVKGKDSLPTKQPDLIVALDVMEHIEPEYLDAVLSTMHGLKPRLVVLLISVQPAEKTLPDGRNAHLIVQPPEWWHEKLSKYFRTVDVDESMSHFNFTGSPLALS
jgi:hypothetical protein